MFSAFLNCKKKKKRSINTFFWYFINYSELILKKYILFVQRNLTQYDEIIQIICQLFLNKNDEVIVPKYSFLMYRIYSRIVGAKVIYAQEDNYKASVENILKKVNKKTKIVFLANPNNPTGTYLNKREILNLRSKLRSNVLLVIDDAYFEYMLDPKYKSGLELFKNSKKLF